MEMKTHASACSTELIPGNISPNTLGICDTRLNKASLPMQNFTDGLPECYVRLVRLPENVTPNQAVKASEFNSFECVNTSQQHIASQKCRYIELDNHSSYCLTCKLLIQDFRQFKESRGNQSSFCRSSFNRQKGSECRGLSAYDDKSSFAAAETVLNINEDEENIFNEVYKCTICQKRFIHEGSFIDHMKSHTNEESFKYPACDYSVNEILETNERIVATTQNLKEGSAYTEEDEHKDIELKDQEICVNKAIKVETETNSKTPEPHFEMLSNASEEDTFGPDFEGIKIEILDINDPLVAANFKLDFEEDEFKKSIQSQGNKSLFCSSIFDNHNQSSNVAVEAKCMETEQNGNNVSTKQTVACPICNKTIFKANLKHHKFTHTGEKPFKCNICQKLYTAKASLEYHLKTHTGEKPFRCRQCDYSAKLKKEVRRHYHLMHTVKVAELDTKKIVCPICNIRITNLKHHMLTHTSEKLFECYVCDKRYKNKESFKLHLKSHASFKCTNCDFLARDNDMLYNHFKNNHTFFFREDVNEEQLDLDNVQSKILETITPTVAINQNLKCNSEQAAEPHFQNIRNNIFEATNPTFEPHFDILRSTSEVDVHVPDFQDVKIEILEATDATSEPHLATISDASEENVCEPHLQHISEALDSTSEPHFDILKSIFKEDTHEPHFQNIKIDILEANLKADFEEEDEFKNIQSESNESPFDKHNKSSDVAVGTKTEQNGNNVSTKVNCPICNLNILNSNLRRHIYTHAGEKLYECNICHSHYTRTKELLQEHYNRIHAVEAANSNVSTKKNVCPICNMRITNLRRHILTHNGEKPFECNICRKRYTTKDSLKYHIKSHTGEKPFHCKECDYSAKTPKEVRYHYKKIHAVEAANSNINTKKTVCPICNIRITNLKRHMLTHTGEKPFECHICQNRYTAKESLQYHIKSHTGEKSFRCTKCHYSAKKKLEVRNHYNHVHKVKVATSDTKETDVNTRKTSICPVCNKRISHLRRHMLTHTGEKPYECNICQKRYTVKESLEYHLKTHTGEKPVHCRHCDYSAMTNKQLWVHYKHRHTKKEEPAKTSEISHENENISRPRILRPFECDICPKRFRSRLLFVHHRKTHTGEKSFKCTECDYLASDKNTLQNHYKNNHTFFVIEEVNVEQPHLGNIQNKTPTVAVNRNLKGNSEKALESRFQNIEIEILEATEPHPDTLNNTFRQVAPEPHLPSIEGDVFPATDSTSELHLDKSNAFDDNMQELYFQNVKSEVLDETSPPSEPRFASEEEARKSHLQNAKSNILEAVGPTVAVNYKCNYAEPEHIQNNVHEEVEVKYKAMQVNTYTEVKTETSETTDLKELPENLPTIEPEEVHIKDELTCEDNPTFTAVQEDKDDLGKCSHIGTIEPSYACNVCKFETADGDNFK